MFVPERIPFFRAAVGGPGKAVLDLGCRSGAFTRHFADGNDVTGVDVDRTALAVAAELGINPVLADVEQSLPFADESFDVVVAGELLEHVRHPDAVIAESFRVLRGGGALVGSVPNAYRVRSRLLFAAGRPPEDDPTHLHMYRGADVERLLAGFEDVALEYVGGRFARLQPRLLARDLVFRGRKPVG